MFEKIIALRREKIKEEHVLPYVEEVRDKYYRNHQVVGAKVITDFLTYSRLFASPAPEVTRAREIIEELKALGKIDNVQTSSNRSALVTVNKILELDISQAVTGSYSELIYRSSFSKQLITLFGDAITKLNPAISCANYYAKEEDPENPGSPALIELTSFHGPEGVKLQWSSTSRGVLTMKINNAIRPHYDSIHEYIISRQINRIVVGLKAQRKFFNNNRFQKIKSKLLFLSEFTEAPDLKAFLLFFIAKSIITLLRIKPTKEWVEDSDVVLYDNSGFSDSFGKKDQVLTSPIEHNITMSHDYTKIEAGNTIHYMIVPIFFNNYYVGSCMLKAAETAVTLDSVKVVVQDLFDIKTQFEILLQQQLELLKTNKKLDHMSKALDNHTIKTLTAHSRPMGLHAQSVIAHTIEILTQMGYPYISDLTTPLSKHDTGKIFISQELLEKKNELKPYEYEELKGHPWLGVELLKDFSGAAELDKAHHERYDGYGYPDRIALINPHMLPIKDSSGNKLKEIDISIASSVNAIADTIDAMGGQERTYRERIDIEKILEEILQYTFVQFHPKATIATFTTIINKIDNKMIGNDRSMKRNQEYWFFKMETSPSEIKKYLEIYLIYLNLLSNNPDFIDTLKKLYQLDVNNRKLQQLVEKYRAESLKRVVITSDILEPIYSPEEIADKKNEIKNILDKLVELKIKIENTSWHDPKNLHRVFKLFFEEVIFQALKREIPEAKTLIAGKISRLFEQVTGVYRTALGKSKSIATYTEDEDNEVLKLAN